MSDEEYELVMPFIACVSNGGVYEDAAFVAGIRMQMMDERMRDGEDPILSWEPSDLVEQLDLVSMRRGYELVRRKPWDAAPSEWTLVEFRRPAKDVQNGETPV